MYDGKENEHKSDGAPTAPPPQTNLQPTHAGPVLAPYQPTYAPSYPPAYAHNPYAGVQYTGLGGQQGGYRPPPPAYGSSYGFGGPPPRAHPTQHQTVIIGGHVPQRRIVQQVPMGQSFSMHFVLACFVTWCCNCPMGLIAFILASVASNRSRQDPASARQLGAASIGVSVAGIIISIVVISVVAALVVNGVIYYPRSSRTCYNAYGYRTSCNSYYYGK